MSEFHVVKNLNFSDISEELIYDWLMCFNSFSYEFRDDLKSDKNDCESDFNKILTTVFDLLDVAKENDHLKMIVENCGSYTYEFTTKFDENDQEHVATCQNVAKMIKESLDEKFASENV